MSHYGFVGRLVGMFVGIACACGAIAPAAYSSTLSVPALTPDECASLPSSLAWMVNREIGCTGTVSRPLLHGTIPPVGGASSAQKALTGHGVRVLPAPPSSRPGGLTQDAINTLCTALGAMNSQLYPGSSYYGLFNYVVGACTQPGFSGLVASQSTDGILGATTTMVDCPFTLVNPVCDDLQGPVGAYVPDYPFSWVLGAIFLIPITTQFITDSICPVVIPDPPFNEVFCAQGPFFYATSLPVSTTEIEIVFS